MINPAIFVAVAAIAALCFGFVLGAWRCRRMGSALKAARAAEKAQSALLSSLRIETSEMKMDYEAQLAHSDQKLRGAADAMSEIETALVYAEGDHEKELELLRRSVADRDAKILKLETQVFSSRDFAMAEPISAYTPEVATQPVKES